MRILAVDNEEAYLRSLEMMLGAEKFNVYGADSADEAIELGKLYNYDLIVLADVPEHLDVIRSLRAGRIKTPILVLARQTDVDYVVRVLDLGADDCMAKPFHRDELVARINAIVRRTQGHADNIITVGDVSVNLSARTAKVKGQPVHLTGKEYQMLSLLALRQGVTMSKEMFLNQLYGGMDEPELKIIDVFICKLRKKLTAAGAPDAIVTVWGRGYLLDNPDAPKVTLGPIVTNPVGEAHLFSGGRLGAA
jgi:two-component system cell cycle response regulator CtrA